MVLESARLAPTAVNKQPFRLIVIKTRGRVEELRRIYPAEWFLEAPVVICACALPDEDGPVEMIKTTLKWTPLLLWTI